ncbi:MAG: hydroxyacylglutathione hydrolase [Gammaproteobacteria bacterium]|nr:hydroxyacylglutathione hydrolase [Gammaproteobacteria bacterium]
MLTIIPIPAFDDNYIWIIHQQGNKNCVVVDPGDEKPVLDFLQEQQLQLEAILITHHHYDHTAGIEQLVRETAATVYGPANETIPGVQFAIGEPDQVDLEQSGLCFKIFDVPGHTRGHIAYLIDDALFSGDCLFAAGCGRLFESTAEQMYHSLNKFAQLPDATRVYCAHEYTEANLEFALAVEPDNSDISNRLQQVKRDRGNQMSTIPTTIALEKLTNPFLRCHLKPLKQAAKSYSGEQPHSESETYATIRQWKDNF